MVTVWHNDRFIDYLLKREDALKDTIVHLIARVDTTSLEEAYYLTNHIDGNWAKNPKVTVINANGKPLRSTSVGDLLVQDNRYFIVEPCGYRELDRTTQTELIFHTI